MRLIALLILPSLAFAAPAPTQAAKPGVELKLSADNQDVLEITIQNNRMVPLKLPYRVTPLEHFVVELQGDNGKQHKIERTSEQVDEEEPGTLTVPAGKSTTLSVHTCHYLPALGEGAQKVTFIARLKLDGEMIESKALTVNP
jgi:hypothetical protein